jgi:hypothetical protein
MEALKGHFAILADTGINSVVFGYTKAISQEVAKRSTWSRLTPGERHRLMDQAIDRWRGEQRAYLERARAKLVETA